MLRKHINSL
jgi:hypothetical protein